MKKLVLAFCVLSLAGCGPSREEKIRIIEDEYSVLDYGILKVEQDLLSQMVEEQEKSLAAMHVASMALGCCPLPLPAAEVSRTQVASSLRRIDSG